MADSPSQPGDKRTASDANASDDNEAKRAKIVAPEWDDEYAAARAELLALEKQDTALREEIARKRRALPLQPLKKDYEFVVGPKDLSVTQADNPEAFKTMTLSELVAASGPDDPRDDIIIIHRMKTCVMCTQFADGFNALADAIEHMVHFYIATDAPIDELREVPRERGWTKATFVQCEPQFTDDMAQRFDNGMAGPGISTFHRERNADGTPGEIKYHWSSVIEHGVPNVDGRGMDLMSPFWNLLDLTVNGRSDFYPLMSYEGVPPRGNNPPGPAADP